MCGIAGIISKNSALVSMERLQKMTDAIKHRGPEGDGFWLNDSRNVGLGHRRLSIIDLSEDGTQPMHYLDRYTITYNGELYNYIELRDDLKKKGYKFKSLCDTEVILASYAFYGTECLQHFDGMFAFALWDEQEQTLFCARDRFGEKPFYFINGTEEFLFASEMKALWPAESQKLVDNSMLLKYITIGLTQPASNSFNTFYTGIYKLPRAHFLTLNLKEVNSKLTYEIICYWDIDKESIIKIREEDAIEQFQQLLATSVKRRLRSDVPLGTSLSGGLDSSSIVATLKELLPETSSQKTFSAVFPNFEKDESRQIKIVTEKFGLRSLTTTPTEADLIKDFEKLAYHQEEPFQSSSIYAQFKVYELARQHNVTVLLDGQGADETLAGYHKYYHWYWQELIAKGEWRLVGKEISEAKALGANAEWNIKNYLAAYLPRLTAKQLEKKALGQVKKHSQITHDFLSSSENKIEKPVVDRLNDILYFNTMQNGLEELLRYADRNSMAHSREVRLPFLNHELVQFVFSLPSHYKIKQGWTKWILRKAMDNNLPNEIVWRKDKVGFEPPQKQWMQNKQVQELIHEAKRKLVAKGILKKEVLNKPIAEQAAHEADNYDWRYLCVAEYL